MQNDSMYSMLQEISDKIIDDIFVVNEYNRLCELLNISDRITCDTQQGIDKARKELPKLEMQFKLNNL